MVLYFDQVLCLHTLCISTSYWVGTIYKYLIKYNRVQPNRTNSEQERNWIVKRIVINLAVFVKAFNYIKKAILYGKINSNNANYYDINMMSQFIAIKPHEYTTLRFGKQSLAMSLAIFILRTIRNTSIRTLIWDHHYFLIYRVWKTRSFFCLANKNKK